MRIEPLIKILPRNNSDSNSCFSYNYMYILHKYNLSNIYVLYHKFSSTMYARDQGPS